MVDDQSCGVDVPALSTSKVCRPTGALGFHLPLTSSPSFTGTDREQPYIAACFNIFSVSVFDFYIHVVLQCPLAEYTG